MTISNWLLGTCGRSHIGIYVCSHCGYELLRSGFEKNFIFKSPSLQGLLPLVPVTVAAEKGRAAKNDVRETKSKASNMTSSTPFNDSMLEDFTKSANMARTYHKNSLIKKILQVEEMENNFLKIGLEPKTDFEVSCGKCGSSLGYQYQTCISSTGGHRSKFYIKKDRIDLQFRST